MIFFPAIDIYQGKCVRLEKGDFEKKTIFNEDPVDQAKFFEDMGCNWIHVVDLDGAKNGSSSNFNIVEEISLKTNLKIQFGGGVRSISDIQSLLSSGADKVSINTAAVSNPDLIYEASSIFGSQCIVVAIDAKIVSKNKWEIFTHGGRNSTGINAIEFSKKVSDLGAGEILLTSMDKDGTKSGYDNVLLRAVSNEISVPVIASGGVGKVEDLIDGVMIGGASAVLAASIFHFGEISIQETKEAMSKAGISVRL